MRVADRLIEVCDLVVSFEGPRYGVDERGSYILPYTGGIGVRAAEAPSTDAKHLRYERVAARILQHMLIVDRAGSRELARSHDVQEDVFQSARRFIRGWEKAWRSGER